MCILATIRLLGSAATVLFGPRGAVSQRARQRQVSRQALYRETDIVLDCVAGTTAQQQRADDARQIEQLQQQVAELQQRLAQAVVLDRDRLAHFASRAQAEGVSLPVTHRLLAVFLGERTPSVAQLGRWSKDAARRSTAVLQVLDEVSRPLIRQAAADELFVGRRPILMTVDQVSLCWAGAHLADRRDGASWFQQFRLFPGLEQVTCDAGTGLEKGLQQVNNERRRGGQQPVATQNDQFHLLREGSGALRRLQGQAARTLERAERADQKSRSVQRRGGNCSGPAGVAGLRWLDAEAAMDHWSSATRAWQRLREALGLFTADGELNTRVRAEAIVAEVLPQLTGDEWGKFRRGLRRPELFTFLDRVHQDLAALPVAAELRAAALESEGLRRQAQRLHGDSPAAGARRGQALLTGVVLALGGAAGAQAVVAVREVLQRAWRASSLVEGVNSVVRMQQARHRRLSQGLLDLKRLYWNCRPFRTGKRQKQTPYGLLGLTLPTADWWQLLQMTPEQLRQQLSGPIVPS